MQQMLGQGSRSHLFYHPTADQFDCVTRLAGDERCGILDCNGGLDLAQSVGCRHQIPA